MQMNKDQQQARLAQIKRQWEQRKLLSERLNQIHTKIGVYSGKGGVGKTTVAVNLAAHLAGKGYSVGLLDADIDCPNASVVLGSDERPVIDQGRIEPVETHGVKMISMSFFQEHPDEATIFRGPMIHNAITQFLQMTDWGPLDFLVVDLPPGTSDAPVTVMQSMSMDGFVVVTTPQALAALDAKRSINMVKKLNVEVLGVVENFTGDIFGSGAGKELAKELNLNYLGNFGLRPEYRDTSKPTVLNVPAVTEEFESIWSGLKTKLEALEKLPNNNSG